ncbi:hypothetical protein [Marinifilum fragile]|uniref:hypothetical protein n=1 Tax=Marinifilum fragile TaxID=570161 RepID=UPI0006D0D034|nr:hypothetical protein [Marinifilum fragile]
MGIFKDVNECIRFAKLAIFRFPNLRELISNTDFEKWELKMKSFDDFQEFLLGENTKLNILNTSVMHGFGIEKSRKDSLFEHYNRLLNKTEKFLTIFPELKNNRSFKNKLINLETFNFLATLSELSLASELKNNGYSVGFESKFIQQNNGKKKDIDISISDAEENKIHIEVYMPNKQFDISEFFDPNQDDDIFISKIKYKLFDKFGTNGVSGLDGRVLLAINKVFFDAIHMKTIIPFLNNDGSFSELTKILPIGIDGLLLFEDDFGSDNSFAFDKILLKSN